MSFERLMSRRLFSTIGARLTLLGALVTFATSAMVCAALYVGVDLTLRQSVDAFLLGEVHELLSAANHHRGDDATLEREFRRELGARTSRDLAFRLYDANGRLLVSSEANDRIATSWTPATEEGRYVKPSFETVSLPGLPPCRLCNFRCVLDDGRVCVAQASYSLARMNQSLVHFRSICLAILVVSVLIAFAVGRFLAMRSLKPIRVLTERARNIGADRLDERLALSGTGDELDQLTTTLNDLLGRIERFVSQLRQFTADASHELRTPLAALRGGTELALSRERSAEGLRRALEENVVHFDRMQRIAEDLLLLSRLDAGERLLKSETVDVCELVHSAVQLYRPVAEERGIQLSTGPFVAWKIQGDAGRIRQVLGNLLDNAVKYARPNGHVQVSISRNGERAQVSIADDGIGIGPNDLPRVFDRFFVADTARSSTNGRGSGLGLSICKSIIEAHGGDIWIESELDRGTTATFQLPISNETREGRVHSSPTIDGSVNHEVLDACKMRSIPASRN